MFPFKNLSLSRPRFGGLWRQPDFVSLWAAESVSQFGSQITLVALPLAAALALDASAGQMGLLAAAGTLPSLIFGLFAGVWVDRLRRRPLMIAADLGRAALLGLLPLAWAFDALRIELLYAVAFGVGVLTLFFDVAWVAILPSLVARDRLQDANGKLHASASVAQVAGPGLAGVLVAAFSAPFAILVDAASFVVSAVFLRRIRTEEPPRPVAGARQNVLHEAREGLSVVWRHALLRPLALGSAIASVANYMFLAVYILYMVDTLGFSAQSVGLVLGIGGVGALVGAVLAEPLARRLGFGQTIAAARLLFGVLGLPVILAVAVRGIAVPLVIFSEFIQWTMWVIATVCITSLRQAAVPDRLLGRSAATMRVFNVGAVPIGSLLGGLLGELIGLRATLVVSVIGMIVAGLYMYASPVRAARELPDLDDENADGTEPSHAPALVSAQ